MHIVPRPFWFVVPTVIVADQFTKALVERLIPLNGPPIVVAPGVLVLSHVQNPGVAFGQLSGGGPLLIAIALAAALALTLFRVRRLRRGEHMPTILEFALALPMGGALGNLIDRFRQGKVTDFFDLGWFPVFNVADCAITVGGVLLAIYFLFLEQPPRVQAQVATETPD